MAQYVQYIPHSTTKCFSKIVEHYINKNEALKQFYTHQSDFTGIAKALEAKVLSTQQRQVLIEALEQQYSNTTLSDKGKQALQLLALPNTYTICTAHQPLIFTGTLYFIYKIAHAIKLAKSAQQQFPEYNFVPIFYMGTEDADVDEVGGFNFRGTHYQWDVQQQQCCGTISTTEVLPLLHAIKNQINFNDENYSFLYSLFDTAYSAYKNLADATRYIVQQLFEQYGLLVIDGNNKILKSSFASIMQQELLQQTSNSCVTEKNARLQSAGYKPQAHSRDINLFYISNNIRCHIEKLGDHWQIENQPQLLTQQQITELVLTEPQNFSPNVMMRPLYQEFILPNVAFIGGGGELAYWLQQKKTFQAFDVAFPVLVLRQSFCVISKKIYNNIQKLKLSDTQLFLSVDNVLTQRAKQSDTIETLQHVERQLSDLLQQYQQLAQQKNINLQQSIEAHTAKMLRIHQRLQQKFTTQVKRKMSDEYSLLNTVSHALMPQGTLQERKHNFIDYYAALGGASWIAHIIESCKDFGDEFGIMYE